MSYSPYPTGTILIPSGPGSGKHLFIIVTKICTDYQHLLLSVTSVKPEVHFDDACQFAGGEHEFIKKHSYIYYKKPDRRTAQNVISLVNRQYFDVKADLGVEHFTKVCEGVGKSKFIPPWAVKYFNANCP